MCCKLRNYEGLERDLFFFRKMKLNGWKNKWLKEKCKECKVNEAFVKQLKTLLKTLDGFCIQITFQIIRTEK